MSRTPKFERVLLKVSGEALMGSQKFGIDLQVVDRIAMEISAAAKTGAQIALVVGGGNIFRGLAVAAEGMERASADHMGMLATVMNGLALQSALQRHDVEARVMSALAMPTVCEHYVRGRALNHLRKGRVVICVAGTGNPYFTTDTAAALRACEMDCDALLKGTQVDGVYAADPKQDPDAERYDRLDYADVLTRGLGVMDAAAVVLARENKVPIVVFSIATPEALIGVLDGRGRCTTIDGI